MIRVMYRWTVKEGDEAVFRRNWEDGTRKIKANCKGAFGSTLMRSSSEPRHFFGIARWEGRAEWDAAQATITGLGLAGPMPESVRFFEELSDLTLKAVS